MPRRGAAVLLAPLLVLAACSGGAGTATPSPSASPVVTPLSAPPTSTPSASLTASPTRSATPSPSAVPTHSPTARPSSSATSRPAAAAQLLWRLGTTRRVVALTFDAGSDAGNAAAILDLLRARGIHASFGVTGDWTRANPALVRRMAREGHLLVNHTDRHRSFTGFSTKSAPLTRAERWAALAAAEEAVRSAAGVSTKPWFRPPYGDRDPGVDRDVAAAGYRYELMWTVDTLGWKGAPPSQVVQRVLDELVPGEVVLLHVGAASTDYDALPTLIDRLVARGYGFVRADLRS